MSYGRTSVNAEAPPQGTMEVPAHEATAASPVAATEAHTAAPPQGGKGAGKAVGKGVGRSAPTVAPNAASTVAAPIGQAPATPEPAPVPAELAVVTPLPALDLRAAPSAGPVKALTVKVPDGVHTQLKVFCAQRGVSVQDVLLHGLLSTLRQAGVPV
jgi:hypothetical protein